MKHYLVQDAPSGRDKPFETLVNNILSRHESDKNNGSWETVLALEIDNEDSSDERAKHLSCFKRIQSKRCKLS